MLTARAPVERDAGASRSRRLNTKAPRITRAEMDAGRRDPALAEVDAAVAASAPVELDVAGVASAPDLDARAPADRAGGAGLGSSRARWLT